MVTSMVVVIILSAKVQKQFNIYINSLSLLGLKPGEVFLYKEKIIDGDMEGDELWMINIMN